MPLQLEFSGSHDIVATREAVWQRLVDPQFITESVPGFESVRMVAPGHFQVAATLGMGLIKLNLTVDIELCDLVEPERARLRASASAADSTIDVASAIKLEAIGTGRTLIRWTATTTVDGTLAGLGTGIVEGVTRKLTSDFWADFARRVQVES